MTSKGDYLISFAESHPKLYATTLSAYLSNKAHAHVPFYETTKNPHLFLLLTPSRQRSTRLIPFRRFKGGLLYVLALMMAGTRRLFVYFFFYFYDGYTPELSFTF